MDKVTVKCTEVLHKELHGFVFDCFICFKIHMECLFRRESVSATAVTEYSGDAGFLCNRPDIIRERIKATFCISMRFVLKCLTSHCLLCM